MPQKQNSYSQHYLYGDWKNERVSDGKAIAPRVDRAPVTLADIEALIGEGLGQKKEGFHVLPYETPLELISRLNWQHGSDNPCARYVGKPPPAKRGPQYKTQRCIDML